MGLQTQSPTRQLRDSVDCPTGAQYRQGMESPFDTYKRTLRRRQYDPKTLERYLCVLDRYRRFCGERYPTEDTGLDFLLDLKAQGYVRSSIRLYKAVIAPFHRTMGDELDIRLPKQKSLPEYWSPADQERVIVQAERGVGHWTHTPAVRERNHDMCVTLAFTGVRRQELLDLRVRDVDFNGRMVHVRGGKGGRDRSIPMINRVVIALRRRCKGKAGTAKVFEGMTPRSVHRQVTTLARHAGLDTFHPHSFRHGLATRLLEQGANLKEVQEVLGHESLETTSLYLALTPRHLRSAMNLLEGDQVGDDGARRGALTQGLDEETVRDQCPDADIDA